MGPEVRMLRSLAVSWSTRAIISPSVISLESIELKPACASNPKIDRNRGRRISASTITTLAPVWAKLSAVFTAVVVFPSPGRLDVTSNALGARPAVESKTEVRRWRYDSASGDLPSTFINNSGLVEACPFPFFFCSAPGVAANAFRRAAGAMAGMTASAGRCKSRSTSSVEWIVSSRYSRNRASPIPSPSESRKAIITPRIRFGPTGPSGAIA